jgi:hypothetical protein
MREPPCRCGHGKGPGLRFRIPGPSLWWRHGDSNPEPPACKAGLRNAFVLLFHNIFSGPGRIWGAPVRGERGVILARYPSAGSAGLRASQSASSHLDPFEYFVGSLMTKATVSMGTKIAWPAPPPT